MTCKKGTLSGGLHDVTCKMLLNALEKLPEVELNPVFEIKRPSTRKQLREECSNKRERLESVDSEDILIFSHKSRSQKRLKLLGSSISEPSEGGVIGRILIDKDVNIPAAAGTLEKAKAANEEALCTGQKPRLDSFSSCSGKQPVQPDDLTVSRMDLYSDAKKIKMGQSAQSQPSLGFDLPDFGLV